MACASRPRKFAGNYYGDTVPAWWMLRDNAGSPGSVGNAEYYQEREG
jgi:hypothetical protein